MIFLGIGGNLPSEQYGAPRRTCGAALADLEAGGDVKVNIVSPWYETAPVPASDQPWFVNAVVSVSTDMAPTALMDRLLETEAAMGRVRGALNAARPLDIDILDFQGQCMSAPLQLPHPRMAGRAFVLLPLRDIAPAWTHPESGEGIEKLINRLPAGQEIRQLPQGEGDYGTEWTGG